MIGRTLGHYEILDHLGVGGMGEVYLARDTELDRNVALKVLPEQLSSDPERLARFKREAKTLASLNHPNIVTIYSVEKAAIESPDLRGGGHDPESLQESGHVPQTSGSTVHFLTMELIEGLTLSDVTPDRGMNLTQILEFAIPLADALAEAHDKGVVHRDLKPGNIMVTDSGRTKVLDFGLAKLAETSDSMSATRLETEPMTVEGQVMGTVPYMSPEQLEGNSLDSRSDVFSLGIVLYEMATGKRPFHGESSVSLMSSIMKDSPPEVDTVRADLPRHLGRIIRQMLEKHPDQRIQTSRDVRNQLEDLKRETTTATGSKAVSVEFGQRHHHKRTIAAFAVLAAVIVLGFAVWRQVTSAIPEPSGETSLSRAGEDRKMIVVLPFENMGQPEEKYFADGMTEEITSRLAALSGLGVISRTSAIQYADERPGLSQVGEELGVDYVLVGSVRWQHSEDGVSQARVSPQLIRVADDTHLWAEQYDATIEDIFGVQSDIARKVSDELGLALLQTEAAVLDARPTENLAAYDLYLQGNEYLTRGMELNRAEDVEIAIEMYVKAVRLDSEFALAHSRQATAHSWLYSEFLDHSESRVALARQAADRASALQPDLPESHQAMAGIYRADRQMTQALIEYQKVIDRQPNNAEVLEAISNVQIQLGLYDESIATLKRAMKINPRLGRLACWTGGRHFALRDFENGIRYHDRAIGLTPDRACPYVCQTWIYMNWDGETARSRQVLEQLPSHVDLEGSPPLNYPWVTVEMMDRDYPAALTKLDEGERSVFEFKLFFIPKDLLRAQIYGLQGDEDREREHYESAKTLLASEVERRPEDPRIHSSLGIALAGLGERDAAVREGNRGLDLLGGSQAESLGYRLKDLAQIYLMVDEKEDALETIQRILSAPTFFSPRFFEIDPTWQPLHSETRFQDLMRKYQQQAEHV